MSVDLSWLLPTTCSNVQTLCGCYLLFSTAIDLCGYCKLPFATTLLSLQISNLMSTSLLLFWMVNTFPWQTKIQKSNKALYKLNMKCFPFFYYILHIIQIKKKLYLHTTFNHSLLHKDKYIFFLCCFPFLSHKNVTHKLLMLMLNASWIMKTNDNFFHSSQKKKRNPKKMFTTQGLSTYPFRYHLNPLFTS